MAALTIVLPIFALVLVGWIARRIGVIQALGMSELNRFVVWLALPALLLDVTAHAQLAQVWQPGFIVAFGVSTAIVFALTVALRIRRHRLAGAALDGLSAAYGNVAFMGFPILASTLGAAGLIDATIATLIIVCALFAAAVAMIEAGLQAEARLHHLALKVGGALLRNPLIVAPLLGVLIAVLGIAVPAPAEKALTMLGGTASPCALITIGLFLGAKSEGQSDAKGEAASVALLVALKLALAPAIAFALGLALHLPAVPMRAALLLAAMPTGTGPFMLAEFYGREARVTSRAILASTVISALTLSALIAVTG